MLHAVSKSFVKDSNHARAGRTITGPTRLLSPVEDFNVVSPDKVKDNLIRSGSAGIAKHALCKVLIELQEFRILPVLPVILFK
jgi:hypothetical protein